MTLTFADEADYLKRKWREPTSDLSTGLERDAFAALVRKYIEEHKRRESWEMTKARIFELGCTRTAIDVSPYDWFPAYPSWHFHRNHPLKQFLNQRAGEIDPPGLGEKLWKGAEQGYWAIWKDFDHCAPDWDAILPLGFPGLKKRLHDNWKDTDFYRSRDVAANAFLLLLDRFVAQGEKNAAACADATRRARLEKEIAALKRLHDGAPQTAYDVLLFIYVFWCTVELFDAYQVRTLGNIDRLLTPYYRADLAAGRTTEAEFREQFRHFWWQWGSINNYWGQPVYIGGTKADGTTEYNEVSQIVLETNDELCLPTPKMHMKMAANTPDWAWRKGLDMARRHRSVAFIGEAPLARQMAAMGYSAEEAREATIWGCNEWAARDSANSTGAGHVNLLKCVADTVAEFKSGPVPETFETFRELCLDRMAQLCRVARDLAYRNEQNLSRVNPSNGLTLATARSVELGVDAHGGVTADGKVVGGTRHGNNSIILLIGLGTTADAIMAVKELVYDAKAALTLPELADLMERNWSGREDLRLRMFRSPHKWGMNDPTANETERMIIETCAAEINGKPNSRGGVFFASGHTARQHIELGWKTGATPDGRHAGEEMSKNGSATMGVDRNGATALINSYAALDARLLPGDFQIDVALLPTTVPGDRGLMVMRALMETYFANGGVVIQFNVHDVAELRDAQAHPEKHEDLMVRVCGWNARWIDMPRAEQEKYILRAEELRQ